MTKAGESEKPPEEWMSETRRGLGGGWRPGCRICTGTWGVRGTCQRVSVTSVIQCLDWTCNLQSLIPFGRQWRATEGLEA